MVMIAVEIYRYNPEVDEVPHNAHYELDEIFRERMVLDVLEHLKAQDESLTFRRSCREGVCGSDGMNINGRNDLACVMPVPEALGSGNVLRLRPLTGMPVIRDLVVDLTLFFKQYERISPYLINDDITVGRERLQ